MHRTTKNSFGEEKRPTRPIATLATALAILCTCSQAHAQSSVTLYGSIVDGIVWANNVGGSHLVKLASGGHWSNNWGITGTEDLGGGLKAFFNLNNTYNFNTGQSYGTNEMWGGSAYVGLSSTTLGKFTMGQQYDYSVDFVQYSAPASGTLFAFHPGAFDRVPGVALANTVSYESPRLAGLRARGMYSFGSATSPTNTRRSYSAALDFKEGNFRAEAFTTSVGGTSIAPGTGAGMANFLNRSLTANPAQSIALRSTDIYGVAAAYDWDKFTFRSNFTRIYFTDASAAQNKQTVSNAEGAIQYKIQPDLYVNGGYTYSWTNGVHWNQVNLATDYFLSKRTDIMLATNFQRVSGPPGQVANMFTIGNSSSQSQLLFYAGIRHFF